MPQEGSGLASDLSIEVDERYDHERHGHVEATGIWQGVTSVDRVHNTGEEQTIVIRYSLLTTDDRRGPPNLVDTIDGFLDAIEASD
ncbi:hypothetical protein [Haloterrigena turkmenica]|uniref:hypothetical protein n=1 Tax=Haloterrigena turkmenica TaxID=62320 RepID=UPI000677EC11|nr:hypothetical protein [Haloterrigena turkmenica]